MKIAKTIFQSTLAAALCITVATTGMQASQQQFNFTPQLNLTPQQQCIGGACALGLGLYSGYKFVSACQRVRNCNKAYAQVEQSYKAINDQLTVGKNITQAQVTAATTTVAHFADATGNQRVNTVVSLLPARVQVYNQNKHGASQATNKTLIGNIVNQKQVDSQHDYGLKPEVDRVRRQSNRLWWFTTAAVALPVGGYLLSAAYKTTAHNSPAK